MPYRKTALEQPPHRTGMTWDVYLGQQSVEIIHMWIGSRGRQAVLCLSRTKSAVPPSSITRFKTSPGKPCFLGRKPVRDHHPMNIYLDPLFTSSSGCPITAREAVLGLSPICKLKIDTAHSVGFRAKPDFCFCCLLAIVQYTLYPPFEMSFSYLFAFGPPLASALAMGL